MLGNAYKSELEPTNTQSRGLAMTVNTSRPNFARPLPNPLSGQRLYLREEELNAGVTMILEAATLIKATTQSVRARHKLTWNSAHALTQLLQAPQGVATLSVGLGITKQAAIKTAEELEARGLLTRAPDTRDGRRRPLTLTDAGEAVARDVVGDMRALLAKAYRKAGGEAVSGCDSVLGALKQAGTQIQPSGGVNP
jgi:DNA-binding MarR family transcriptional regulator